MWDDPHISKQLLDIHLSQEVDLASRKESSIKSTIDWILNQCPTKKMTVLDLGCGPGLYCEKICEKGHDVTGIDISRNSLDYARSKAKERSHTIEYINSDYLDIKLSPNRYDLVFMVYTDFGVLNPAEQRTILEKIYQALKPNGLFIFDVINDKDLEAKVTPLNWEIAKDGFWSNKPYMVLSNSFLYPAEKVILYQHIVVSDNDKIKTYRFWTQHFSERDISELISGTGFSLLKSETGDYPESVLGTEKYVSFFTLSKH